MFVLKSIVFTVVLLILCDRVGYVLRRIAIDDSLVTRLTAGFIGLVAMFHVFAVPLVLLHVSFAVVFVCFIILALAVAVLSIKMSGLKIYNAAGLREFISGDLLFQVTLIGAVLLILLQACTSAYLCIPSADDSFYVSLINTVLNSEAMFSFDPSTGNTEFPMTPQYACQTWEVLLAVWAKMFMIEPAALAHTVLPFFLILISYCSYASLAGILVPRRFVPLFLILLSVFHVMGGYAVYSQGSFLLLRIWHGKAVFLHVLLPFFWANMLCYMKHKYANRFIIALLVGAVAGTALNPIAIYLLPMLMFGMLAADVAVRKIESVRGWKVLFVIAPLLMCGIIIRLEISDVSFFTNPILYPGFEYLRVFKDFMGQGRLLFVLYIAGAAYLWFQKQAEYRSLFVLAPIALLLTAWNPLFATEIARNITSFPTYWRVFWLLPLGIGLGAFTVVAGMKAGRFGIILSAAMCVLVMVSGGKLVYAPGDCSSPENVVKIPQDLVLATEFIEGQQGRGPGLVLAPEEASIKMRQISSQVTLFWSRAVYVQYFLLSQGKAGEFQRRSDLFSFFASGTNMPSSVVRSQLRHFGIDWVVLACNTGTNSFAMMNDMGFRPQYSNKTYAVFRIREE